MDSTQGDQNCQFFILLAESVGALMVSLMERAKTECPLMLEAFRRALLPVHRAMADFLGQQPPFENPHQLSHSVRLRDASANPFRTLPSLHHHFYPRHSHPTGVGCWPAHNITPPDDITPPPTPNPSRHGWPRSPIGFTSTPFREPAVVRPRPEPFALINQLLTAMRTSEDSVARVADRFAHDPIFRSRMLTELDALRSLVEVTRPERATPDATANAAGLAISTLLDRVEQAEITLSSLIRNLQQLEASTLQPRTEADENS